MAEASMWRSVFSWRMLICISCGFSSGMPYFVTAQMLPAWLQDSGVDIKTIGLFALIGVPYTWKFVWSPLMDRYNPPGLGRRRGWALIAQVVLLLALAAYAMTDPQRSLSTIAAISVAIAFFSATQDIALDAYRRELLPDEELGLGNGLFVNAYRLSSLVPGSLALILADRMAWSTVHLAVAAWMSVGILTTLVMPEPAASVAAPRTFAEAVIEPFREFFARNRVGPALLIFGFMLLYKLGDSMAATLITPFYLALGFTMTQVGSIAKVASLWASIAGATLGGVVMVKLGINRALWVFGVVQMISTAGFALLSEVGPDPTVLFLVVSFEFFGVGLGTAAFVSFIARNTDLRYTATQFALLTSLAGLSRTFAGSGTGFIVDAVGYTQFFLWCAAVALPGMALLPLVAPWRGPPGEQKEPTS